MAVNRLLGAGPGRARTRLARPRWPCVTLHEGQPFPASGIEEPLVLCMVSIPPPACRHPAPDRVRSSGKAGVFDCGSAGGPPIWCRPRYRGAPRQDHPGALAPSEAEDQRITAVQASKGHTHRNMQSDSLPLSPALASVRSGCRPARLSERPDGSAQRRLTGHGGSVDRRARATESRDAEAGRPMRPRRGEGGRGAAPRAAISALGSGASRGGDGARGGPGARYTCANQLVSSPSGSAVARTASIASISSFVCTPLRRMAAGPSPAGTTTDSTASAVSTP